MANLLSDWLSQELLRATQEAVEWKKAKLLAQKATKIKSEVKHEPGTFPSDDSDDEDERFQDDGSNIRVELTRPIGENSRLQILNITQKPNNSRSYHCDLSDGHRLVKGQLQEVVRKLQRESGLRPTELGGTIINVKSFTLALTPYGKKDEHISLDIGDAKFRKGSTGIGRFGHPERLRDHREFDRLFDLLARYDRKELDEDDEAPKDLSQHEVIEVSDNDEIRSQDGSLSEIPQTASQLPEQDSLSFSTQVPVDSERRKFRKNTSLPDVSVSSGVNLARPEASRRRDEQRREQLLNLGGLTGPVSARTPKPPAKVSRVNSDSSNDVEITSQRTLGPTEQHVGSSSTSQTKPLHALHAEKRKDPPANVSDHTAPTNELAQATSQAPKDPTAPTAIATDSNPTTSRTQQRVVSEVGLSQPARIEGQATRDEPRVASPERNAVGAVQHEKTGPTTSRAGYVPRGPDARYLKYSRLRIPREQRDVLQRKHSWLPSEPGEFFPSANVPVGVLRSLVQQKSRPVDAEPSEAESELPAAGDSNDRNSSPKSREEPIGSQSQEIPWSSSPVREPPTRPSVNFMKGHSRPLNSRLGELPPDSSDPKPSAKPVAPRYSPSSPTSSQSSDVTETNELENDDQDLPTAVPRSLNTNEAPVHINATRLPPDSSPRIPSSAPTQIPAKRRRSSDIEVQQSPYRSPARPLTQSTGEAVPATQPPAIQSSSVTKRPGTEQQPTPDRAIRAGSVRPGRSHERPGAPIKDVRGGVNGKRPEVVRHPLSPKPPTPANAASLDSIGRVSPLRTAALRTPDNASKVVPPSQMSSLRRGSVQSIDSKRSFTGSAKVNSSERRANFMQGSGEDHRRQERPERHGEGRAHEQHLQRDRDPSPPKKKQRSGLQWGSQDVADEDPAEAHKRMKRDAFRKMCNDTRVQIAHPSNQTGTGNELDIDMVDTGHSPINPSPTRRKGTPVVNRTDSNSPRDRPTGPQPGPSSSRPGSRPHSSGSSVRSMGTQTELTDDKKQRRPSSQTLLDKSLIEIEKVDKSRGPNREVRGEKDAAARKSDAGGDHVDGSDLDSEDEEDDEDEDGIEGETIDEDVDMMEDEDVEREPVEESSEPWQFGSGLIGDFAKRYFSLATVQQTHDTTRPNGKIDVLSWKIGR
ncbi:hypothetical protein C1H76_0660 [Elsinoe australis]|uniref:Telomere replication protein EST3 n=1 Tax=Elsinoe australis TaxID=40998 RepID=A0A4U7B6N0_9PEZI|nr:hypothetical protein C1H76_0660 [Elsinoe australis]